MSGGGTYAFGAILNPLDNSLVSEFQSAQNFFLKTPWGSNIAAVGNYVGFWDFADGNYYKTVHDIFIQPLSSYPASGNIKSFRIFYAKSTSSQKLGDTSNGLFPLPAGAEAKINGFNNGTASSESRSYFFGKVFDCVYDPGQNIFFFEHPIVG